jgi:hypothetical protein
MDSFRIADQPARIPSGIPGKEEIFDLVMQQE